MPFEWGDDTGVPTPWSKSSACRGHPRTSRKLCLGHHDRCPIPVGYKPRSSKKTRGSAARCRTGPKAMPSRRKNDAEATPSPDSRRSGSGISPEHLWENTAWRGHLQGGARHPQAPMSEGFRQAARPVSHRDINITTPAATRVEQRAQIKGGGEGHNFLYDHSNDGLSGVL